MQLLNFFQNLFGGGNDQRLPNDRYEKQGQPRHSFRNPIWQNDEDDDDEIGDNDFRNPRNGFIFSIFSDPLEMTKFFEAQMDNMLSEFFSGYRQGEITLPYRNATTFDNLPYCKPDTNKNLRDEFLKPGYEQPPSDQSQRKVDGDLDGKISAKELFKIWTNSSTSQENQIYSPNAPLKFRSFGSSTITSNIRRPDGTMEQRQIVKDSEGNEQTTITRQIGDKVHTIVKKRDKSGIETTTENMVNIHENELKDLEKKWTFDPQSPNDPPMSTFPWHKFFGLNPKL